MSKYLVDKFLFTVDRDPELTERYREDPAGTVEWWEAELANTLLNCTPAEGRRGWPSPRTSGGRCGSTTTWRCSRWARTRSSR